tara:strand:+ start:287 stop:604 length:318 start_codon:yes stop_codon:yes gene_type:complete
MRHDFYQAVTEATADYVNDTNNAPPIYLKDGTRIEKLSDVTNASYRAHHEYTTERLASCLEILTTHHPDTRRARIAYANRSNLFTAQKEYVILIKHLGLSLRLVD